MATAGANVSKVYQQGVGYERRTCLASSVQAQHQQAHFF